MKEKEQKNELVPLSDDFFSEFALNELEERLETDPLMLVNPFEDANMTDDNCMIFKDCPCNHGTLSCTEVS